MIVVSEKSALRLERKGMIGTVGFVPTMGFLHEGHLSLIKEAKKENDCVVVSIFVNPTQFGVNEDLEAYPKNIKKDLQLCEAAGVDLVWVPENENVYHTHHTTSVHVGELTSVLCGKSRPDHFDGVTTVVAKLFNLVRPDQAYFGQKDYQQLAIIRAMVRDLDMSIKIVGMPTIREVDGLAKSSRNSYLSDKERRKALALSKGLQRARRAFFAGMREANALRSMIVGTLDDAQLVIDYVEIVHPDTLISIQGQINEFGGVAAIAAFVGSTRLIDNARLDLEESNNLPFPIKK